MAISNHNNSNNNTRPTTTLDHHHQHHRHYHTMAASVQMSSQRGRHRLRRNDPLAIVAYATIREKDHIRDAIDCLQNNTHVRSLSFLLVGLPPPKWMTVLTNRTLSKLPHLEELSFFANHNEHRRTIVPEDAHQATHLFDFLVYLRPARLQRLTLHATLPDVSAAVVCLSCHLPQLHHVSLSIDPSVGPLLKALRKRKDDFVSIRSLQLIRCHLDDADTEQLVLLLQWLYKKNTAAAAGSGVVMELDLDTVSIHETEATVLLDCIAGYHKTTDSTTKQQTTTTAAAVAPPEQDSFGGTIVRSIGLKRCSLVLHQHFLARPPQLQKLTYHSYQASFPSSSSSCRLEGLLTTIREVHLDGPSLLIDRDMIRQLTVVLTSGATCLELLSLPAMMTTTTTTTSGPSVSTGGTMREPDSSSTSTTARTASEDGPSDSCVSFLPLLHALTISPNDANNNDNNDDDDTVVSHWGAARTKTPLRELRVCWTTPQLMDSIPFMANLSLHTLVVSLVGMNNPLSRRNPTDHRTDPSTLWLTEIGQNTVLESLQWKGMPQRGLSKRNKCLSCVVLDLNTPAGLFARILYKLLCCSVGIGGGGIRSPRTTSTSGPVDPTVAYRVLRQRVDLLR